mmetsp:Transcript_17904/g.45787  ORF Transcript_17904/g.45787 Transcript_17904/m.45787 type:complete len:115 (+) Transcript_17904:149-493(+)|eukprot:CAMPEP_0115849142 /NCGR_PEP_ID=MMETSP0287-20121206/11296_1 /TAXON_ID=412157 /ORGANISM="Chrysochromulina rotalis, Strain UIO044" /LENGTH=114 /DNA_ID=CAMNT_0003303099 /DNA_START=149 /DNA_END=493 /DNA_ORIENTATION=+
MAADWNTLANEYKDSEVVVVADVDCTSPASKELCTRHRVDGYPTLKTFQTSSSTGVTYSRGRSLAALRKHASTLGPRQSMWAQVSNMSMTAKSAAVVVTIFVLWVGASMLRIVP